MHSSSIIYIYITVVRASTLFFFYCDTKYFKQKSWSDSKPIIKKKCWFSLREPHGGIIQGDALQVICYEKQTADNQPQEIVISTLENCHQIYNFSVN